MLSGKRKSVEPVAVRVEPERVATRHQSLHPLAAKAPREEEDLVRAASDCALEALERHGAIGAWIVDDPAMVKKGRHSFGAARQWLGRIVPSPWYPAESHRRHDRAKGAEAKNRIPFEEASHCILISLDLFLRPGK